MQGIRRTLRTGVLAGLTCAAIAPSVAAAAPEIGIATDTGNLLNVATEPDTGRSVALTGRSVPDGNGALSIDMFASAIDGRGRSRADGLAVGGGMKPDFSGGPVPSAWAAIATDTKRRRHIVVWSANKPGMGSTPCAYPEAPPWLPQPAQPAQCLIHDQEIYVRILDRTGRARGVERKVSDVGPPDRGEFSAAGASVAYDETSDTYVLVYAGRITGNELQAALFSQRLNPDGSARGGPRLLALQPEPVSFAPVTRLAADPNGGYLLVYSWGTTFQERRLYARRLTPGGRVTGGTRRLTSYGVGSIELAFDRQRRRALVIYAPDVPGGDGLHARLLSARGRPLADRIDLTKRLGEGAIRVGSDPERGGWVYAYVRAGQNLTSTVFVQRASSTGKPSDDERRVSKPDRRAFEPNIAALAGGTVLVAWAEQEIHCDSGGGCVAGGEASSIRARLIRPLPH